MSLPILQIAARKKEMHALAIVIALILLVGGLGVFSLSRLSDLHSIVREVDERHIPAFRDLNDVAANSERLRNLQSLTLLTREAALKQGVAKRMASVVETRKAALDRHMKSFTTAADRDAFVPVTKAWDEYMALAQQALSLHQSGRTDRAVALYNTEAQQAMDRYRAALHSYADHLAGKVQLAADRGNAIYAESRVVVIYVFLFAVPMCLLAGASLAARWL